MIQATIFTVKKLKVKDHVIHTILIDPNSSIYNSYALALYSKTSPPELLKFGRYYDIEDHIIKIVGIVNKW